MAKRSNRSRHSKAGRVVSTPHPNASRVLVRLPRPVVPLVSPPLSVVGDLRTFHPLGRARPAPSLFRSAAQLVVSDRGRKVPQPSQTRARVSFRVPGAVLVCVRRQRRKEVLHARGVAGGPVRPPRRSTFSDVRC